MPYKSKQGYGITGIKLYRISTASGNKPTPANQTAAHDRPARFQPAKTTASLPSQLWTRAIGPAFSSNIPSPFLVPPWSKWRWPPDRQRGCFSPPTNMPTTFTRTSVSRARAQQQQHQGQPPHLSIAVDDATFQRPHGDSHQRHPHYSVSAPPAPAPAPRRPAEAEACQRPTSPTAPHSPRTRLSGSCLSRRRGLWSGWDGSIGFWSRGWRF